METALRRSRDSIAFLRALVATATFVPGMLAAQDGVRPAPSPQPANAVGGATRQEIKRPPTPAESQAAWRKIMLQRPRPKPEGCFTAEHPVTEWREGPWTKAPQQPYPPAPPPPARPPPA